ncbi:MAG: alpha/beta hydrolase [Proteobacteria bacterium]|nr:alpha/beta hydrolase [Pseudomonadota bacterium]
MSNNPNPPRIEYRIRNKGAKGAPPIVYIHGAMCDGSIWQMLSGQLARALPDREGYMIDLPGHGSTTSALCERIEDYSKAVIDFLEENQLGEAVIIGHSMGGAIAQQIGIDNPEKADCLVLLATGARLGVNPQFIEAFQNDFDNAVSLMKDFMFAPNTPEKYWKPALEQMKSIGPDVPIADFATCTAFDSVGQIDEVKVTAIVCCGENDFLTNPKKNRRLADSLGCKYFELPDTGHMIQIERATELTEIITDFLS